MSSIIPLNHQINIIENILDELNRRVRRTVPISKPPNQLREKNLYEWNNLPAMCDVNETPLSCRSEECGGHTHGH